MALVDVRVFHVNRSGVGVRVGTSKVDTLLCNTQHIDSTQILLLLLLYCNDDDDACHSINLIYLEE